MADRNSTPPGRVAAPCACGERQLKVGYGFYERRARDARQTLAPRPVPWIRLKGQWLAEAGFTIDARLKIRVMRGCLVVTVEQQEEENRER